MKWALLIPGILAGLFALQAWVVELLFNWIFPYHLTFWMACGIIILVDLLFGGVRKATT